MGRCVSLAARQSNSRHAWRMVRVLRHDIRDAAGHRAFIFGLDYGNMICLGPIGCNHVNAIGVGSEELRDQKDHEAGAF